MRSNIRVVGSALAVGILASLAVAVPAATSTANGSDVVSAWGHSCTRTTAKKAC